MTEDLVVIDDTTDLTERARQAYALAQAIEARQVVQARMEQIGDIGRALAKLDIAPAAEPFINAASGQICVPLILGEVRVDTGEEGFDYVVQTHAVAAEWDDEQRMVRLVADIDYDDYDEYDVRDKDRWLYPAGYLYTLADLGKAIKHGGRKTAAPTATAAARVEQVVRHGLTSDFLDEHDNAILSAAEAVCAALADIADVIRAGNGL